MKYTVEYHSEKYGDFSIQKITKNSFVIWWDYEECGVDGIMLEPDPPYTWDVKMDFSDVPKDGLFKSLEAAKSYIENKFGKIE